MMAAQGSGLTFQHIETQYKIVSRTEWQIEIDDME